MRTARTVVGVAAVVLAAGCTNPDSRSGGPPRQPATDIEIATPVVTEEVPQMPSHTRHRATVITDAGRIDASALDGDLDVDVASVPGWESIVRPRADGTRVEWTSGERSVIVELRVSPTGISQQVVATN